MCLYALDRKNDIKSALSTDKIFHFTKYSSILISLDANPLYK